MPTLYPSTAPITIYPGEDTPADYPVQNNPNGAATSVVRGLKQSLLGIDAGSAASAYYRALAEGDTPRATANGLRAQQLTAEAERAAPRVRSLGDIHGVGDGVDWAAGVAGQLPTSLVPAVAGGLVGGGLGGALFRGAGAALGSHLGAGAAMYPQLRDAARLQHSQSVQAGAPELPAQQVLDDTSQQAMVQGGVEALVPGLAARSLLGAGARVVGNPLVAGAKRVGRDIALDSGAAGVSEGVAMGYETGRDPGRDTSGDTMRYVDAMASEAVGGGVMGAMGYAGDLAHTALGTGLDVAGKGGAYAARLAEQGGKAGMDKAKEMWGNRPQSLDEAAVMVGEGAANLHNQAEDAVTRVMQRGKDPDVDTLLVKRAGKTEADMRADDVAKHTAAANFIAKNQANTGDLPPYVQAAMADYAAKPNAPFSWEPLADAVNDMHRAQGLGESLQKFADEAAIKLGKGAADARNAMDDVATAYAGKRQADGRANAQDPYKGVSVTDTRDDGGDIYGQFEQELENAASWMRHDGDHAKADALERTRTKALKEAKNPTTGEMNTWGADLPYIKEIARRYDLRNTLRAIQRVEDEQGTRQNAQTPDMQFDIEAARDELSPLLDEALAPLTGLKSQDALDNALPSLNYALRTWVQNKFGMKPDGEPVVPKALLDMFTDPGQAVQATVDLLHRQGLVDDSILPRRDRVLEQIQVKQLARQQAGMIVDDMLVPTKAKGLTAVDHDLIAEDLMDRLQRDEVSTAEARALFGPRARVALDALWAKINAARPKDAEVDVEQGGMATRTGYDEGDTVLDGEDDGSGSGDSFEELNQMTNARDPSQDKADTTYHPYNPRTQEPFKVGGFSTSPETGEVLGYHDEKAPQRITELQAKNGGEVKRVGYMDYLREKHGNDAEALMGDAIGFLQRHDAEIRAITDKYIAEGKKAPRAEDVVNKNWYMLKEVAGRKGEGTDATVASLGREGNKGQIIGNEWAERSDGEHGTVKEGRIWLERELSDGSKVAFATSTGRIVGRMASARKGDGRSDESNGLAGQVTLLRQGLASLLSASHNAPGPGKYGKSLSGKSGKGEPVLTGRVGYKETANGPIKWLAEGEDFPDNLRMHSRSGQTYAQAKAAAKTQRDDELVAWAKRQLELLKGRVSDSSDRGYKGAMMDLQRMEQALKKPDLDALDQLRREDDYKKEKERESRKPIGADTKETQRAAITTAIDTNNRGEKFTTKKEALEHARDKGDRVVKRAGHWIIERSLPYSETKNTGLPTEISEMGKTTNVRSRAEDGRDNQPRNVDELTGKALHTDKRETAAAKSDRDALAAKADAAEAAKQARAERTAFLLDALRQGVPAFNALARKLPDARRAALLAHLKAMIDAKTADNPIWGGKPPKDLSAFANRARAALVALGEVKGDTKKPGAKVEVTKPSAPPAQKLPDVLKRMNDYIDNPPADYSVKQLEVIRDWATKQEARLNEAKSKYKEGQDDEWERLDDLHHTALVLKLKATKAIATEADADAWEAENGGPTRYNAMATRIHTDLGRGGFAATHDSPIKHEGKFDWRAHIGKGEGHAAFGAGTYLSTNDGVHKNYKNQFTAKATDAALEADPHYQKLLDRGRELAMELGMTVDREQEARIQDKIYENEADVEEYLDGKHIKSPTYEVSVDIKPEHLLDWNKPLSEQSALVQKALAKEVTWKKQKAWNGNTTYELVVGNTSFGTVQDAADTLSGKFVVGVGAYGDKYSSLSEAQADVLAKASGFTLDGANIYKGLVQRLGSQAKASDYLQSLGILGHKYAAAGGKNDTHPNYVIYDDTKITTNYVHFNKQAADPTHGTFGTAPAPSAEEQAKFHADILRRLGPQMKSALLDVLVGKGARGKDIYLSGKWEKGAIYASLYARNIGQIGAHEAFHEFFSRLKGEPAAAGVLTILERAANSPFVTRQLERLLDGEKEALRQINPKTKHSAEERMAYMFQFWQAGLLKIGPETQGVFTKLANFFRNVVGMLTNDQKADKLLRMFDQGHMQTPDAAARVLAGVEARGSAVRALNKAFQPALERGSRLINTAETHLHNQGKEYDHIRRLFKRSVGESGGQGFFDAKDHQMKMWGSKLADILGDATPKDLELAAGYLHSGKAPTDKVVARLVREIKGPNGLLPQLYKYLDAAGVERMADTPDGKKTWEEMGKVEHYFPRAYDTAKIATDTEGFVADLMKYNQADLERAAAATNAELKLTGDDAQTAEGVARAIANRLVNGFGQADLSETDSGVGFSPFMRAVNRRSLHWLAPEILAKYGEKDVARVLTTYIAQATKRAEYVRRFGNGGYKLKEMLEDAHTHRLDALAEKEFGPNAKGIYSTTKGEDPADRRRIIEAALATAGKADVKERLDALELKALKVASNAAKDVMAMEGTLGYDIKPGLRRFNNTVMVYENLRLLSTSLFSQFIDPLGMVVRGATMSDAWNAYKRGLREVVASIKGERINDLDAKIAGMVGTADMNGFLAAYGQAYGSQFLGEKFRNVNEQLFRFNGMEGFNRGMQVAGTRAAINFIKRHVESPSANSKAYLAELNLKAADVKLVDGELDYTNPRIARAIHQWVNGAVLRPNAAQRPAWASDPHFMLFWHMKQFAYTFHDVILKRALHNYKQYGDIGPASVLLAGYIPVMIASDAAKSLLLTGDEPVWMKQGLDSEVQHGAMRAGLLGKFQPLADVTTANHTVLGVAGPAVEQIAELFTDTPGQSAINALPGSNVINAVKGHSLIEGHSDY